MSIDDRIQFIQQPIALPGICAICGFPGGPNSDGRQFVDWGLSLEFYGAVIFCTNCFKSGAEKLGFLSYEDTQLLRRQVNELIEKVQLAGAENDRLRAVVDNIRLLPHYSRNDSNPVPESSGEPEDSGEDESGPIESDNGGGYSDVQDANGDDLPGASFVKF